MLAALGANLQIRIQIGLPQHRLAGLALRPKPTSVRPRFSADAPPFPSRLAAIRLAIRVPILIPLKPRHPFPFL